MDFNLKESLADLKITDSIVNYVTKIIPDKIYERFHKEVTYAILKMIAIIFMVAFVITLFILLIMLMFKCNRDRNRKRHENKFLNIPRRSIPVKPIIQPIENSPSFNTITVLVCGATYGMGFNIASYYHSLGAKVFGTTRRDPKSIQKHYCFKLYQMNTACHNSVENFCTKYLHKHGSPDIMVFCAGQMVLGNVPDMTHQEQSDTFQACIKGPINVIKTFTEYADKHQHKMNLFVTCTNLTERDNSKIIKNNHPNLYIFTKTLFNSILINWRFDKDSKVNMCLYFLPDVNTKSAVFGVSYLNKIKTNIIVNKLVTGFILEPDDISKNIILQSCKILTNKDFNLPRLLRIET
jgi:hypothetical protein